MIGGLTLFPHAMCNVEFLPILVGTGRVLHDEHGVFCNDDKCRVGDGIGVPFVSRLGVFEVVYILRDALTIKMIILHIFLE